MSTILPDHILKLMKPEDRKPLGKVGFTKKECSALANAKTEKQMHLIFSDWLRLHNIPFIHSRMDAKSTIAKGVPDFTLLWEGQAICVEFKMPGGKGSEDQIKFIEHLNETGTPAFICYMAAEAIELAKKLFKL